MKGRKGQPAEVRAAKGNPGKRANPVADTKELPTLSGGAPRELTDPGKEIWRAVTDDLGTINLLRITDRVALTRYCNTLAEYWKATRAMRRKAFTYEAKTTAGGKMLRVNPLFMIQDRIARRLDSMEDRFGLNPRARQEIMYRLASQPLAPSLLAPDQENDDPAVQVSAGPIGFLNLKPAPGDKPN